MTKYDEVTSTVGEQYKSFLLAITATYLINSQSNASTRPSAVSLFKKEAVALESAFITGARALVTAYASRSSVDESESVGSLIETLKRTTAQNIKQLTLLIRGRSKFVTDTSRELSGSIAELAKKKSSNPEFKIATRGGRALNAQVYIKLEVRHFAYILEINERLREIGSTSDLARVTYLDANHKNNGLIFSIAGGDRRYPSLADIRKTIFHHNASASVSSV